MKNTNDYVKEIYSKLKELIDNLYIKYAYIDISLDEYTKLILKGIRNGIKTLEKGSVKNLDGFFERYLQNYMKNYVVNLLNKKDTFIKIMNNYINNLLNRKLSDVRLLEVLVNYFEQMGIDPQLEFYTDLIVSNETLNNVLKNIVNENLGNDRIIQFVEAYSLINQISIKENVVEDDEFIRDEQDIVETYLKEIGGPLLTEEEEKELGFRILEGDKEAQKILVERNLRLVVSIARKYVRPGMDFIDLVQEGNIGLMKAAEKFDVTKGYKFSTYAIWWIRQAVSRTLEDKGSTIRVPVHFHQKIREYNEARIRLSNELNRTPTLEEIALKIGADKETITRIYETQQGVVYLDEKVNTEEEDTDLGSFLLVSETTAEDEVMDNLIYEDCLTLINESGLTDREKQVIILRYGIGNSTNTTKTLQEVGEVVGVTRERIRQIEGKAIRKMRKKAYASKMFDEKINKNDLYPVHRQDKRFKDVSTNVEKLLLSSELSDLEIELVIMRYGLNGKNPKTENYISRIKQIPTEIVQIYLQSALLKIRNNSQYKYEKQIWFQNILPSLQTRSYNIEDYLNEEELLVLEEIRELLDSNNLDIVVLKLTNLLNNLEELPYNLSRNNKDLRINITEIVSYDDLLINFSLKEIIVICLRFGYLNDISYAKLWIASLLNINSDEITNIIDKMMVMYKDEIDKYVLNNEKTLVRKK